MAHARKKLGMLLGGVGIWDEGCSGCKIAWHHPVSGDPGGRPRWDAYK